MYSRLDPLESRRLLAATLSAGGVLDVIATKRNDLVYVTLFGGEFLVDIIKERDFDVKSLTWYLPHLSSQYFGPRIDKEHVALGIDIPLSKWFTNLSTVGNVGAGSPYLMLEEMFNVLEDGEG